MNFVEAITTCLGKYATFAGRATRPEFWWFFLFQILLALAGMFISETVGNLVSLALLLPGLAVGSRRLHDIGKSGWWQLITITGIGFFLLVYWWVQPERDEAIAYQV